ncbi:MAG: toxin-antitoxin system HicB family antitoxin [Verrucomicrobium sp.]
MNENTSQLPDSLYEKVKERAHEDGVSINQFLASAAAEKVSAFLTAAYLKEEAKKGDAQAFRSVLKKVPASEPDKGDELSCS